MIPRTFQNILELAFSLYDEATNGKFSDVVYANFIDTHLFSGYRAICRDSRCAPAKIQLYTTHGQVEYDLPRVNERFEMVIISSVRCRGMRLDRLDENHIFQQSIGEVTAYYPGVKKIGLCDTPGGRFSLEISGFLGPADPFEDRNEEPDLVPVIYRHILAYYLCREFARVDKSAIDQVKIFNMWAAAYQAAVDEMSDDMHNANIDAHPGVM